MNYYYDIILNWSEEEAYNFYEWLDTDYLELVKKIPFIKVKHKSFLDIALNKVKISSEVLNSIKDKTLVSGKNIVNKIDYACLITDNKNIIAIEFNKEGISTNRSKLLIEDEINALEVAFALKEVELDYEVIEKISFKKELRQEADAKHIISLEINNLYQNKELSKLRYLYYEYKKEKCEDIDLIYKTIVNDLETDFKEDLLKLYNIIKLSYHNV